MIPRSEAHSNRPIARKQESFNVGMITDIEAIDLDNNSVADLTNARGHNNCVKGAVGTRLWQDITLANVVPVPFNITLTNNIVESFDLTGQPLGILRGDPEQYEIRCVDSEGNSTVMYITKAISPLSAEVDYDKVTYGDAPSGVQFTGCVVTGKINARHYDETYQIEYMMQGHFVYARGITSPDWKVYTTIDRSSVVNAESQMFKIGSKIVLLNGHNIFVLGDPLEDDYYIYTANGDLPDFPLDKQAINLTSANPSTYRYMYGLTKQTGSYTLDRNSKDTFIEVETPPFLRKGLVREDAAAGFVPYDEKLDYTQVRTRRPIDDTFYYRYIITDPTYYNAEKWEELQSPFIYIQYGTGDPKKVFLNFTAVETMNDVAKAFERSLADVDSEFRVRYDRTNEGTEEQWIEAYHPDKDVDWSPDPTFVKDFTGRYFAEDDKEYLVAAQDDDITNATITDGTNSLVTSTFSNGKYTVTESTPTPLASVKTIQTEYYGGINTPFTEDGWTLTKGRPMYRESIVNFGDTLGLVFSKTYSVMPTFTVYGRVGVQSLLANAGDSTEVYNYLFDSVGMLTTSCNRITLDPTASTVTAYSGSTAEVSNLAWLTIGADIEMSYMLDFRGATATTSYVISDGTNSFTKSLTGAVTISGTPTGSNHQIKLRGSTQTVNEFYVGNLSNTSDVEGQVVKVLDRLSVKHPDTEVIPTTFYARGSETDFRKGDYESVSGDYDFGASIEANTSVGIITTQVKEYTDSKAIVKGSSKFPTTDGNFLRLEEYINYFDGLVDTRVMGFNLSRSGTNLIVQGSSYHAINAITDTITGVANDAVVSVKSEVTRDNFYTYTYRYTLTIEGDVTVYDYTETLPDTVSMDFSSKYLYFDSIFEESLKETFSAVKTSHLNDNVETPLTQGGYLINDAPVVMRSDTSGYSFESLFYPEQTYAIQGLEQSATLVSDNIKGQMGNTVQTLRYPKDRKDLTHYSVYRTKDIYPYTTEPHMITDGRYTDSAKPNLFAWVNDVPACVVKTIRPVATDGTIYDLLYTKDFTSQDVGNQCYFIGVDTVCDIKLDGNNNVYLEQVSGDPLTLFQDYYSYFGTSDVAELSTDDTGLITGTTFTLEDAGKTLFWANGTLSTIAEVSDAGVATTVDKTPRPLQGCAWNPTSRVYHDTNSDVIVDANTGIWPLGTRYYEPLKGSQIATYNNGVLMTAIQDTNDIHFSKTGDFRYIGYHHSVYEKNQSIEGGIRCMFTVNDMMCVLTQNSTHNFNPKAMQIVEDTQFGEYYLAAGEPYLVHSNIGTTHQFKWKYGEKGDVMVLTNEPAVRFFNGHSYNKNLADGRIQHTELQKMAQVMILSYSPTGGIHLWGKK
ncbi:MAG: hypothetical protein GY941_22130 [Planctomycetes bacterium]|nr:hypothetical protein [Planctomycetota bacterium]